MELLSNKEDPRWLFEGHEQLQLKLFLLFTRVVNDA